MKSQNTTPNNAPSREEIAQGMAIAAQLIDRYGSQYWPVLERLKQEYDALDERDALLVSLLTNGAGGAPPNFG